MRKMLLPVLVLLGLLLSNGCGKSLTTLNQLTASGSIQEDALVKTYLQIEINAPPAKVWALLTDASSWPKWQRGIESVTVTTTCEQHAFFLEDWRHKYSFSGTAL